VPEEIKLWRIEGGRVLENCDPANLDLEERLETWIEQDISILSPGLLIIGRQVETDFGGVIDLLCINQNGDLVIVELKRGLTPREITAQALDYASWVRELSNDRISTIADRYLGEGISFESAFAEKFGTDLPDVLNENHSILVVGSRIDASTERIINYLSDAYGVSINAITFQYFTTSQGDELLARVFLIDPDKIEYQAGWKRSSKRRRNLTYDELQDIAEEKGVGDLYQDFVTSLNHFFKWRTTGSSIAFTGDFDGSRKTVLSLIPPRSSREDGLHFQIYFQRFCQLFGVSESEAIRLLPEKHDRWIYYVGAGPDYSGFSGYFRDADEIGAFLEGLSVLSANLERAKSG
jgi:hypothetical protein